MERSIDDSADDLDDSIFGHVLPDCFNDTRESGGFQELSFSSTLGEERGSGPVSCSTPRKAATTRRGPSTSAKPASERLPCSQCGKTYANRSTLAVHTKMHNMASKFVYAIMYVHLQLAPIISGDDFWDVCFSSLQANS